MFFVHPQIKLNKRNFKNVIYGFFKKPDFNSLEKELSLYFSGKKFVFTDMARSAFKIICEKMNLENSQILLPAYICDIFYPILKQYNIKPIFLDIDLNTFNVKVEEIQKKITPDTKAILISHTYGLAFDIKKIREIVGNDVKIIEDCAHAFGLKIGGNFAGNLGDMSFFSLYKQFPSLRGGMLVYPKDWGLISLPKTSFSFRDLISFLNCFPFFAFIFKKFGNEIAPKFIRKEKLPEAAGINKASLNLFSDFKEGFDESLKIRKNLALFFQEELKELGFSVQEEKDNIFCYFSALVPQNMEGKRDELVERLKMENVFCTRIWHTPIVLNKEVRKEYRINLNDFPNTVKAAKRIINFPLQSYYAKKDIEKMINLIKKALKTI
jgi:dTDP-4-amino-4,6-dideoxygalactose transaminase